jgi:hypothetical protein
MDWFERLTGFPEAGYDETRRRLEVDGCRLRSLINKKSYSIGELELVSLQMLRDRAKIGGASPSRLEVQVVTEDVGRLHQLPEYRGALFQVASQFNLLEMISPEVTPEHGVTRYQHDATQGPACAMAAGAATIYRNYFVPVGDRIGQTAEWQLDGLADVGAALRQELGPSVDRLWTMQNGYALCTRAGLRDIGRLIASRPAEHVDALRGLLRIGIHQDVEVTNGDAAASSTVTQAFCSALPVAYGSMPSDAWQPFATFVLEAAYEATLWAAVANAHRTGNNVVLLTRLGGGAFGNRDEWIDAALRRALLMAVGSGLDVRLVSHGPPLPSALQLAHEFSQ